MWSEPTVFVYWGYVHEVRTNELSASAITLPRRSYGGSYTVRDAALFLRVTTPSADVPVTVWAERHEPVLSASSRALYAWIRAGVECTEPQEVSSRDRVIGFHDLVRLRMYAVLRSRGVQLREIRAAEEFARQLTGRRDPFLTEPIWTYGSDVFLRWAERLIAATRGGQVGMEELLREYLRPVLHGMTFDDDEVAQTWSPHAGVLVDPEIEFGAPCIEGTRVQTEAIWAFWQAGDSVEVLARAYGLGVAQIEDAIGWEERLASAA